MPNRILNEETRASLPITALVSMVVSLIAGTTASITAAYGMRDRLLERVHRDVVQQAEELREERRELYLTKQDFYQWRETERVRQDRQYYQILNAIERLNARLGSRR